MKQSHVEVDLRVLEQNIRDAQQALGPRTAVMFVVKANAYGHGLAPVARQAADAGVRWFAVAYLQEALELRKILNEVRILILGVVEPDDIPMLLEHRIIPIVASREQGLKLSAQAKALGTKLPVHIKVDTGMGRLGLLWDEVPAFMSQLGRHHGLEIQGICTHFATVKPTHLAVAQAQMERFVSATAVVEKSAKRKLFKHVSSSRAFSYVKSWDFDAVRPGIALYGYGAKTVSVRVRPRPVLRWKTHVIQVKKLPADFPVGYYGAYVTPSATTVATLCVGYADGYPRKLGNKGHVLIRGLRCPVIGRVSMNWITVDLGAKSDVREGDEAVLIGEQGAESIWADEVAALCETIPYEILTGISPALPRNYIR